MRQRRGLGLAARLGLRDGVGRHVPRARQPDGHELEAVRVGEPVELLEQLAPGAEHALARVDRVGVAEVVRVEHDHLAPPRLARRARCRDDRRELLGRDAPADLAAGEGVVHRAAAPVDAAPGSFPARRVREDAHDLLRRERVEPHVALTAQPAVARSVEEPGGVVLQSAHVADTHHAEGRRVSVRCCVPNRAHVQACRVGGLRHPAGAAGEAAQPRAREARALGLGLDGRVDRREVHERLEERLGRGAHHGRAVDVRAELAADDDGPCRHLLVLARAAAPEDVRLRALLARELLRGHRDAGRGLDGQVVDVEAVERAGEPVLAGVQVSRHLARQRAVDGRRELEAHRQPLVAHHLLARRVARVAEAEVAPLRVLDLCAVEALDGVQLADQVVRCPRRLELCREVDVAEGPVLREVVDRLVQPDDEAPLGLAAAQLRQRLLEGLARPWLGLVGAELCHARDEPLSTRLRQLLHLDRVVAGAGRDLLRGALRALLRRHVHHRDGGALREVRRVGHVLDDAGVLQVGDGVEERPSLLGAHVRRPRVSCRLDPARGPHAHLEGHRKLLAVAAQARDVALASG